MCAMNPNAHAETLGGHPMETAKVAREVRGVRVTRSLSSPFPGVRPFSYRPWAILLLSRTVMKVFLRWLRSFQHALAVLGTFHLAALALFGQGTVQFRNTSTTLLTTNSTALPPPGQEPF